MNQRVNQGTNQRVNKGVSRLTATLTLSVLIAACAHDPARDRPIEPWASPAVPPTTQIGDDGGGSAPEPDAGPSTGK